jgi:hypothetical protein
MNHYKARAELWFDMIEALYQIHNYNEANEVFKEIELEDVKIHGLILQFKTDAPIETIVNIWKEANLDLHYLYESIKLADEFDGERDNLYSHACSIHRSGRS